jgi:hypothetical protein
MAPEINKYIPLDKSWIIRMGILDLINGYKDINSFLEKQSSLSDDLIALKCVAENWDNESPLDVGESGTLYRFVRFYLWKSGKEREIIKTGSLKNRKICNNPEIINWPLAKLLSLDNKTSQWASASVLMGNKEKIEIQPEKLRLSYEAVEHWNKQRKKKECWLPKFDSTIRIQARAYIDILKLKHAQFVPKHSEDYCFARAFNLINPEEGLRKFPSLESHETNRINEMEIAIKQAEQGYLESKDHRIIQAIVMERASKGKNIRVAYPKSVSKSWPLFWDFMKYCSNLKESSPA